MLGELQSHEVRALDAEARSGSWSLGVSLAALWEARFLAPAEADAAALVEAARTLSDAYERPSSSRSEHWRSKPVTSAIRAFMLPRSSSVSRLCSSDDSSDSSSSLLSCSSCVLSSVVSQTTAKMVAKSSRGWTPLRFLRLPVACALRPSRMCFFSDSEASFLMKRV